MTLSPVAGLVGLATAALLALSPAVVPPASAAERPLKVLQFNIWQGGQNVDGGPDGIADTVVAAAPDVIMLSESSPERVARLAQALRERGLSYHDNRTPDDNAVLSRFPITSYAAYPSWSKAVIDFHGTEIAAYSGHLEYRYYLNYLPRGYGGGVPEPEETSEYGWDEIPTGPITDVELILRLNHASGRTQVTEAALADAAAERNAGRIAIMAGDFNEPSHLDWTALTRSRFDHHGVVVPWTTTKAFEAAGFIDSYRERYPNPLINPGFTWPSDNVGAPVDQLTWTPKADERDRIDYILYHPDDRLRLTDSVIVGPRRTIVRSERVPERGRDRFLEPTWTWPTDHKAVLSTFNVRTR